MKQSNLDINREVIILGLKTILVKEKMLTTQSIKSDGTASRQSIAFNLLLYFCDVEKFYEMTESNIAAIRRYAYFGLLYHNHQENIKSQIVEEISTVNAFIGPLTKTNHWFNKSEIDRFLYAIRNNVKYRDDVIQNLLEPKISA